jgi:AcrR family transcriptional regulator
LVANTDDRASDTGPRDRSRRKGRQPSKKQSATRGQIVDGAIACILELGFYRASTNEIARRANVSWSSIQHYFGSREALLLGVLEELNARFTMTVSQAEISGDSLEDRLYSLYSILSKHYGAPTHLARLQIILNLSHDPDTSGDVEAALARIGDLAGNDLRRLLRDVLGDDASPSTMSAIFNAFRGTAISHQITDSMPWHEDTGTTVVDDEEVRFLLAGLAAAVRLGAAKK